MSWPIRTISEITTSLNARRVPVKAADRAKRPGPFPYYGASGIVDWVDDFIYEGTYLLVSEDGENLRSRNTPIAFLARGRYWVNNHAHILDEKEPGILQYLGWALNHIDVSAYITGAAQPKLNKRTLNQIALPIPPVAERLAINATLGALDDKIELNRRIAGTLEEMARALYRSWFVDFDPVRARAAGLAPAHMDAATAALFPDRFGVDGLPDGWVEGSLGSIAALDPEKWSSKSNPGILRYVDLAGVKRGVIGQVVDYTWSEAPSRARKVLRAGDTIVGTVRPGNNSFAFISDEGLTGSTGFAHLRPMRQHDRTVLYLAATDAENIAALTHAADGAAYPAVRPAVVADSLLLIAPETVRIAFEHIAGPLIDRAEAAKRESRTLAALRDALLPKLMSGELTVREAESRVGELV